MCKIALAQEFKLLNLLRLQNVFRRQLGFVLGSEGGQNNSEENKEDMNQEESDCRSLSNFETNTETQKKSGNGTLFCGIS